MAFQFNSFLGFMAMDGHGIYVWCCYCITALVVLLLVVIPSWQKKQLMIQLARQQRIEQKSSRTHQIY